MGKTRNFKGNSINRGSDMRLKSILKEVKNKTNKFGNLFESVKYKAVLNETAINGILNSGVLSIAETQALSHYFKTKNIREINESTSRRIDEDMNLLREGWFDDTVDWLKTKKDSVVDALKSGWGAVKKIWGKFKDLLVEFAKKLKDAFMSLMKSVTSKIQSAYNKLKETFTQAWYEGFQKEHPHEHSDLVDELKDLLECSKHIAGWIADKVVSGGEWATAMINGTVDPKVSIKVDEKGLENSIEKVTEEGLKYETAKMYETIFSSKDILSELLVFEGHLEDALKGPEGKKGPAYYILKWGMNIVKFIISPATLLITKGIELIAPKIFVFISSVSKALKGPGIYEFALLTLMGVEVYEIVHNGPFAMDGGSVESYGKEALKFLLSLIPGIDVLIPIIEGCAYAIMAYSLGTIIYNIMSAIKNVKKKKAGETDEEPEVQTAGYKPKGQFKMKEGKLIFVS